MQKIPDTFMTLTSYKKSFIPSLVEETHADLRSNMLTLSHAPTCEILTIVDSDGPPNNDLSYDILYKRDTETDENLKGLMYEPQVGDIIALTNVRPKCIDDLNRPPRFYHIAYVSKANDIDEFPDDLQFKILSSKPINYGEPDTRTSKREPLFAVYLMNLTTNVRVWKALKSKEGNTNIINKVQKPKSDVYVFIWRLLSSFTVPLFILFTFSLYNIFVSYRMGILVQFAHSMEHAVLVFLLYGPQFALKI